MPEETTIPTSGAGEGVSTSAPAASSDAVSGDNSNSSEAGANIPRSRTDIWDSMPDDARKAEETNTETAPEKVEKPEGEQQATEKTEDDDILDEIFKEGDKPEEKKSEEDPEALIKAQPNNQARKWARGRDAKAKPVDAFLDSTKPISEMATQLKTLEPARYQEFETHAAHSLIDNQTEGAFQRIYAIEMLKANPNWDWKNAEIPKLSDVIKGNAGEQVQNQTPPASDEVKEIIGKLDSNLPFDWRNPENDENFTEDELNFVKLVRIREKEAQESAVKDSEKDAKIKELTDKMDGFEQKQQTAEQTQYQKDYEKTFNDVSNNFRSSVESKLLPKLINVSGLEISDNDTPDIKALKTSQQQLYTGTEWQKVHNIPSEFETFAVYGSSVAQELEEVKQRLAPLQQKQAEATVKGDTASAKKYADAAKEDVVTLWNLFAKANTEFKQQRIAPMFGVIGSLSTGITNKLNTAANRVEVLGNAQTTSLPPRKEYANREAVWDDMVTDEAQASVVRAN